MYIAPNTTQAEHVFGRKVWVCTYGLVWAVTTRRV